MEEILQGGEVRKIKENVGKNTGMNLQSLKVVDKQLSGEYRRAGVRREPR